MVTLDFGNALKALKDDRKVCRSGWNGKGMWLKLITRRQYQLSIGLERSQQLNWIGMKTADDMFVPWFASQTDMLAEDWIVLE